MVGLWEFLKPHQSHPGVETDDSKGRPPKFRKARRSAVARGWMSLDELREWVDDLWDIYRYIHPATWIEVGMFFCLKVVPPGDLDSWQLPVLPGASSSADAQISTASTTGDHELRVEQWKKGKPKLLVDLDRGWFHPSPLIHLFWIATEMGIGISIYIWYNCCCYAVMAYMIHDM